MRSWWAGQATSTRGLSRTPAGLAIKHAALDLPLPASRSLTIARFLPAYARDAGIRRQWRLEDALERSLDAAAIPAPPTGPATIGTSERVIEVPWVLGRIDLASSPEILDTGSAFAPHAYRRLLRRVAGATRLHLADLVDCDIPGASAHRADIRALPFAADRFDVVICISTLEHIGLDNDQYGIPKEDQVAGGDLVALRELGRVVRSAGRLLVTVPGGCDANHRSFRQYSPTTWCALVEAAGLVHRELDFFAQHPDLGWQPVGADEVVRQRYGSLVPGAASGLICANLERRP
ncbi:MAG TPA: class I SAM-dependent methyltransferase [Solirubrobacteraceae bacterium]|nr:class I SAM-dependent methyltransferase [Solirubrobacteraceae bacterium]